MKSFRSNETVHCRRTADLFSAKSRCLVSRRAARVKHRTSVWHSKSGECAYYSSRDLFSSVRSRVKKCRSTTEADVQVQSLESFRDALEHLVSELSRMESIKDKVVSILLLCI